MENPFEEQPHRIQRPTFLSVLCILTFIGSGWGVLSNLFSLFTADLLNSTVQMEQYSSMMDGMNAGETLSNYLSSAMTTLQETFVHAREIHVMSLVLSIVSLLGDSHVSAPEIRFLSVYDGPDSDTFCGTVFCRF